MDDARLGLARTVFARLLHDERGQVLPLLLLVVVALLAAGMLVFWLGVSTNSATAAQTAADAAALAAEKNVVQQLEQPPVLEGGVYVQPPIDWGKVRTVADQYAGDNGGKVIQLDPIQLSSMAWDVSLIVSTLNGMPAGSVDAAEHAIAKARASTDPVVKPSPPIPISNDASVASGPRFVAHGGTFGFFPVLNANYSQGKEPELAGRLDQFGINNQLHLVGRVGYMPSTSANDTTLHDCGAASTTDGLPPSITDQQLKDAGLERLSAAQPGQPEEIALVGTSQSSCSSPATQPVAGNGNVHLVPWNGGPQGTLAASAGSAAGVSANAGAIMSYLIGQGLTRTAAAGVVGNLQQESGLNPNAPGGGLAQWQSPRGPSSWDLASQLQYLVSDLKGAYSSLLAQMNAAATPGDAAVLFQNEYERPGVPMQAQRIAYANAAYQLG